MQIAKSVLLLTALGTLACNRHAGSTGGGTGAVLSASLIDAEGRPGSVLIQVLQSGKIDVPGIAIESDRLRADLRTALAAGGSADTNLHAFLKELVANPLRYITRLPDRVSINDEEGRSGSGLIITPDGYVVTNAHVVAVDETAVIKTLVDSGYTGRVISAISRVIGEAVAGFQIPEDVSGKLQVAVAGAQAAQLDPAALRQIIRIVLPQRDVDGKMMPVAVNCKTVVIGKRTPGKDVAVLKCDGGADLPTVSLAASAKNVAPGEDLFVIGYPGPATYHAALSKNSVAEASLTMGHVSALKSMADGWSVIQTDAAVTHGNSGGPAFESHGKVVGIVTFGSVDSAGTEIAGFNYVIPVDVINEFLLAARVTPKMSDFSLRFNQAAAAYQAGSYAEAKKLLAQLDTRELGGYYVTQLQARMGATAASTSSSEPTKPAEFPDPKPTPRPSRAPIVVMAGLGVLLVAIVIIIASSRGSGRR